MTATVQVPALMGPALLTGREQLVRICASGHTFTPDEVQEIISFAEHTVRMIEQERKAYEIMEHALEESRRQVSGVSKQLDRLYDAMRHARSGSDPEALLEALANPNAKPKKGEDEPS